MRVRWAIGAWLLVAVAVTVIEGCGGGQSPGGSGGAAATGGGAGTTHTGGTAPGGATGTGGVAAGGAAGTTVGSRGGNGGGGAAGAGGGGAGTGGDSGDDRLLPLEVARVWTFQLTAIDPASPANCPRPEADVTGTATNGTQPGWAYRPTCSDQAFDFFMNGDDIWRYPTGVRDDAQRFQYASAPVQEGATWTTGTDRFVWRDAGSVQSPAGTFDHCWRRAPQSANAVSVTFCRGVGVVLVESVAANYRLALVSKNF
jgi:hypothetical protein